METSGVNQGSPPALNSIPNYVNPATGTLIKRGRFKSAGDVVSTFQTMWWADLESSRKRAYAQSMIDLAPPYSEAKERRMGLHGRTNVNWGLATQSQKEAEAPYNDILEGLDVFGTVPTNYGDEATRLWMEPIISEEITRMISKWPSFHDMWQFNAHLFTMEGLSFVFFEDDIDWRWDVKGQQHFKFPRRTRASVEAVDVFGCKVDMTPNQLYAHCRDDAAAADEGWDKEQVWEAIKQAAQQHSLPSNDFQEWEKAWKNNDILFGVTNVTVETIHLWAQELDGTVSRYIVRFDGAGSFLYKSEGKYHSMSRVIIPYKYGVGSNGDFHSIRGHAAEIFGPASAVNRLLCKSIDAATFAATPHLVCTNEDAVNELPLTPTGPYMMITDGVQFAQQPTPDYERSLMPVLQQMMGVFASRSGQYTQSMPNTMDNTERTKYEQEMRYAQQARISTAGMNLFFSSWELHFKEIVRRVIRKGYSSAEPGGQYVQEFIIRCKSRGVPIEAIEQIDVSRIEINSGIGKGSAAAHRAALDQLEEMLYRMDARGQNIFNRMKAASLVGTRIANLLFPDQPGLRPTQDAENAQLENQIITLAAIAGAPQRVQVLSDQNHDIHLQYHISELGQLNDGIGQQQMPLEVAIPQMEPLFEHSQQHFALLDPKNPNRPLFKESLQQLGEVITNGAKHVEAEKAKAEKQAMEQGAQQEGAPQADGQTPNGILVQSAEAGQKLRDVQDLQHKEALFQQQLAHDKIKTDAEIAKMDALTAAKIRASQPQ